jgi:hypothetical protein
MAALENCGTTAIARANFITPEFDRSMLDNSCDGLARGASMSRLKRLFRPFVLIGVVIFASGCIRTQELPLAPNAVRLDTHASGVLFAGQAAQQTLHRAAELTLQNGYTHFRLEQANVAQGSELSGVYLTDTGSTYGNSAYVNANASGFSTPIYRPKSDIGVTVVMFHAGEPGAKNAFDAAEMLRRANH